MSQGYAPSGPHVCNFSHIPKLFKIIQLPFSLISKSVDPPPSILHYSVTRVANSSRWNSGRFLFMYWDSGSSKLHITFPIGKSSHCTVNNSVRIKIKHIFGHSGHRNSGRLASPGHPRAGDWLEFRESPAHSGRVGNPTLSCIASMC